MTSCSLQVGSSHEISCISDARKKKNIVGLPDGALAKIRAIKPSFFVMKDDKTNWKRAGFIAQDLKPYMPEATPMQESGYYGLDSTAVLAYAVKAIQEQQVQIDGLRRRQR